MTELNINRGLSTELFPNGELNAQIIVEEGCWYLCTDTAELFLGLANGELKRINGTTDLDPGNVDPAVLEALRTEINTVKNSLGSYALKSELPSTENFANKEFVQEEIRKITIPDVSKFITEDALSDYAKTSDIPSLDGYAKQSELFSKDYNDLVNKPTIPSVEGLATKAEIEGFASKEEIENLASTSYVDTKVDSIKVPTKVSELTDVDDYATKQFVTEAIATHADLTEVKTTLKSTVLPTVEKVETEIVPVVQELTKANNVPFTDSKIVVNSIGGFVAGEDIKDLTVAQLFAKLLGFTVSDPVEPELPSEPTAEEIIESIITKETPVYQITDDDQIIEVSYSLLSDTAPDNYTPDNYLTVNDNQTGFYQVEDDNGNILEAGYQHNTASKEPYYIVALPEYLEVTPTGNVQLQLWDTTAEPPKWVDALYILTSDYQEIVNTYNADGITPPSVPEGYKLWADLRTSDPGTSYRFIIKDKEIN